MTGACQAGPPLHDDAVQPDHGDSRLTSQPLLGCLVPNQSNYPCRHCSEHFLIGKHHWDFLLFNLKTTQKEFEKLRFIYD